MPAMVPACTSVTRRKAGGSARNASRGRTRGEPWERDRWLGRSTAAYPSLPRPASSSAMSVGQS